MTAETTETIKTACLLVIGNEILSGRTQDVNVQFLGRRLGELGIPLREVRIIPDVEETIVGMVRDCAAAYDYLFTTGGIGPTHDDITSACVARAFRRPLERNAEAVRRLSAHYEKPEALNAARLRMATLPEGAVLIDNPVSAAPGFQLGNVFVLAGVPRIMQAMFDGIANRLAGGPPMRSRALTVGIGEGAMAPGLGEIQTRYPALDIGSYPFFRRGSHGTSIVVRGTDADAIDAAIEEVRALMTGLGGTPIEGDPAWT